jgi:hypothetical protein
MYFENLFVSAYHPTPLPYIYVYQTSKESNIVNFISFTEHLTTKNSVSNALVFHPLSTKR